MESKKLGWLGFALAIIPALRFIPEPHVQIVAGVLAALIEKFGLDPASIAHSSQTIGAGLLAVTPKLIGRAE